MFAYKQVCLEQISYALPPCVVPSVELERSLAPIYERFGLHEGRLELMTGIKERRFWEEGAAPSDGSTLAGQQALAASDLAPDDIECLIHASVSRDFLEPATASVVHHNLHLPPRSLMYDISNACLGVMNGIIALANMIELGQVTRGLIVAGESSRQLVGTTIKQLLAQEDLTRRQFKNAFASLTIGSGAVAVILTHESVSRHGHRILGGSVRSATQHNDLCRGSSDTGFADDQAMSMVTDSETLLVAGCALAKETWADMKTGLGWNHDDVHHTFCHQVGTVHRDRLYEALGLDTSKDFSTFEFLGNVGSVSLPLTMAMGVEQRPPQPGAHVAMLGIGSGLSSVMLGVQW